MQRKDPTNGPKISKKKELIWYATKNWIHDNSNMLQIIESRDIITIAY